MPHDIRFVNDRGELFWVPPHRKSFKSGLRLGSPYSGKLNLSVRSHVWTYSTADISHVMPSRGCDVETFLRIYDDNEIDDFTPEDFAHHAWLADDVPIFKLMKKWALMFPHGIFR